MDRFLYYFPGSHLCLPYKDMAAWPIHSISKMTLDFIFHCIRSCAHTLVRG